MFVSRRRFILKTCGTTTPLQCLGPLMLLVEKYAGFDEVEDVFYSRKNFKRPDLQKNPHRSFEKEVTFLDSFFANVPDSPKPDVAGGTAYCLGSPARDCWYLYTLNPTSRHTRPRAPDQTLEVLMTDLDPEVMKIFTQQGASSAADATQKSGIDLIIPQMVIDDYLFEPCGYSMNGITKNGCYMTIHITPEKDFSYVSFETNMPQASYKDIINRVVNTFRPGKVVITVFANKESTAAEFPAALQQIPMVGETLRRQDTQYCHLHNYDLTFAFYSKFPS
ncbi:S-adenosylmethionine decarboxylase proenzyme [Macrosteles quadrilineatus]|uniref:S-adenosylmethionine decarboxylase proenzyme n=1 Tax=Macrosteles quadrilineatus TaxID=74068 RepID=UPI0023E349BC|nr:S-adenosylmethionine decarboxylase proenzyme [Macrosteles quadrilineatus]